MCGRYQLTVSWRSLLAFYGLDTPAPDGWSPRHNVCPTHLMPVVRADPEGRRLTLLRWGFPAPWLAARGKDPWSRALINAKSEEAARKRTWARSFRERRCVVPATGFIEWAKVGTRRLPVSLRPRDAAVSNLGAIWSTATRDGEPVEVFSILTTAPSADLHGIHDRMPVHVDPADVAAWLDPDTPADEVARLTQPWPDGRLRRVPLPTSVNRAGREPAEDAEADWALDEAGLTAE